VADVRFTLTAPMRAAVATVLLPIERALLVPVRIWQSGGDYVGGLSDALAARDRAQLALAGQAERAARADALASENARLRALLDLRPAIAVKSIAAEVLYDAADPFTRKVIVDRGTTHGVRPGAPAINEGGVVGQVTRVYPLNAEITLVTDKDAVVPVINQRTQQRSAAFGGAVGGTAMELRFMAGNADVQVGDVLTTSGLDGVYPPGLPVAKISRVERRGESGFARIELAPAASIDGARHLLLLEPTSVQLPPRPEAVAEPVKAPKQRKGAR